MVPHCALDSAQRSLSVSGTQPASEAPPESTAAVPASAGDASGGSLPESTPVLASFPEAASGATPESTAAPASGATDASETPPSVPGEEQTPFTQTCPSAQSESSVHAN